MKIIDWEKKGHVVRFYIGLEDTYDWWGDDWDDTPYEHNSGIVYDEYIAGFVDIAFPYDWIVSEPAEDWTYNGNSPFSKRDFFNRNAPFLVVIDEDRASDSFWSDEAYSRWVGADGDGVYKFYYGDSIDVLSEINKKWKVLNSDFTQLDAEGDFDDFDEEEIDMTCEFLSDPLAYGDAVSEGLGRSDNGLEKNCE